MAEVVTKKTGTMGLLDIKSVGFDANVLNSSIEVVDLGSKSELVFVATQNAGAWGATVLIVECSCDEINWFPVTVDKFGSAATGINAAGISPMFSITTKYFRIKVSVAAGAASIIDIHMNAK